MPLKLTVNYILLLNTIRVATDQAEKKSWVFQIKLLIKTNSKRHNQKLKGFYFIPKVQLNSEKNMNCKGKIL